jgi:hypothetical protein
MRILSTCLAVQNSVLLPLLFHSVIALEQAQSCSDATTASVPHAMLFPAATKFSTIGLSIWS